MTSRRLLALWLAVADRRLPAPAWAEDPVRIGAVFPLTGAAASEGTALRDAVEVAADIINNPHPGRPVRPPARGRGRAARSRRAARSPSSSATTRAARPRRTEPGPAADHPGEGRRDDRRLSVEFDPDRQRDRRALRHPVRLRRVDRAEPDRAELQMVLPHHPDRRRFRRGLRRLPRSAESQGHSRRQRRADQREHRIRHLRGRRDRQGPGRATATRSASASPTRPPAPMSAPRCCSSSRPTPTSRSSSATPPTRSCSPRPCTRWIGSRRS